MKNDLDAFEKRLQTEFHDPPLPRSLEAERVAETLKKRLLVKAPAPMPTWKRALGIAAAVLLLSAAVLTTVLFAGRGRLLAGSAAPMAEGSESISVTQDSFTEEAAAGDMGDASTANAPQDTEKQATSSDEDPMAYTTSGAEFSLSVASDDSGVPLPTGLDEKVSEAIMASNPSGHDADTCAFEAHRVLGFAESAAEMTVYAEAAFCSFAEGEDGAVQLLSEEYFPLAVSFVREADESSLKAYLQPQSAEENTTFIDANFPDELVDSAKAASNKEALTAQCAKSAEDFFAGLPQ